ncbi:ceramidase domain-containing protein [Pseudoruegeria sp. SK021]|uniref:ceramidase domain-containing protein n=1 Tax=Pseudoruegeria sp. SK021 TaxID=1933035 RepID=UPI000A241D23|nr:ceramidase domain-containing protein [Pseudoruegeria sp. SK021]OSP54967.1 hypothetical protein BV911_09975 [Pseudoruegeria sp. SK021]
MDLTTAIDGYCERLDPSYWAEPVNALSNVAFLVAAVVMWRRTRGLGSGLANTLVGLLAAIGIGSFLFHTHAQVWSSFADVGFIALFAVVYVFVAHREYWGLGLWAALGATALFVPYVALTVPVFQALPFFQVSAMYWPLPLLMVVYGVLLRRRAPETAQGLLVSAALLTVSLTFRSLDRTLCGQIPFGTHFLWHLLNGVLLGGMIEVYRRHRLRPTT